MKPKPSPLSTRKSSSTLPTYQMEPMVGVWIYIFIIEARWRCESSPYNPTHASHTHHPKGKDEKRGGIRKREHCTYITFWNNSTNTPLSLTNASRTTLLRSSMVPISNCKFVTTLVSIYGKKGRRQVTMNSPCVSLRNSSSTRGCNNDANIDGSMLPNASSTDSSRSVTMVTNRDAIFSVLHGTTPCQPRNCAYTSE